jgi:hypothetical protein
MTVRVPGIYGLFFPSLRFVYIGASGHCFGRLYGHLKMLRTHSSQCWRLQRAFDEVGESAMVFRIIERTASNDPIVLRDREQFWITEYLGRVGNGLLNSSIYPAIGAGAFNRRPRIGNTSLRYGRIEDDGEADPAESADG